MKKLLGHYKIEDVYINKKELAKYLALKKSDDITNRNEAEQYIKEVKKDAEKKGKIIINIFGGIGLIYLMYSSISSNMEVHKLKEIIKKQNYLIKKLNEQNDKKLNSYKLF